MTTVVPETATATAAADGDSVVRDCEDFLNMMQGAGFGLTDVLDGFARLLDSYAAREAEGGHGDDRPDITARAAERIRALSDELEDLYRVEDSQDRMADADDGSRTNRLLGTMSE